MTLWDLTENIFYFGVAPLIALCIAIAFHEYGHYVAARLSGIRTDKFSIGFGKEVWGFTDKSGTRWCLSRIPLGGYVQIFGDVDKDNPLIWDCDNECSRKLTKEELAVSYCTKSVWQRLAVVIAGPFANFLLTFLLLFFLFTFKGVGYTPAIITALGVDSESYKAGFQLGDEVLEMDGRKIRRWSDVYRTTFLNPGKKFTYKVLRDGKEIEVTANVQKMVYTDRKGVERSHGRTGMVSFGRVAFKEIRSINGTDTKDNPELAKKLVIENMDKVVQGGIQFQENKENVFFTKVPSELNKHIFDEIDEEKDKYIFFTDVSKPHYLKMGLAETAYEVYYSTTKSLVETYNLLSVIHKGKNKEPLVAGVAKISEHVGKAAKQGWYMFIYFLAVFSMAIGLINLLPIPVLDGGHIVFLFYEMLARKPASRKIQDRAFIVGLILLGGIMIFANINDLVRLLSTLE